MAHSANTLSITPGILRREAAMKLLERTGALLALALMLIAVPATAATVVQSVHRDYDTLGRVYKITYPDQRILEYTYDENGNRKTQKETLSPENSVPAATERITYYDYDALNRLKTITDANKGITTFTYDGRDNTVSVEDPRHLITSYTYNGFDELIKLVSPDTGTTTYDWKTDPGVLRTQTDARLKNVVTTYDAIGRPLLRNEGQESVSYIWDSAANGKGKLHIIERNRGAAITLRQTQGYDILGRLASVTQLINVPSVPFTNTRTVLYGYDSSGRLETITYPSDSSAQRAVISYSYDAQGRVSGVKLNGNVLIRDISWAPFGGIRGWTWGNGLVHTRTYDQNGRLDKLAHGTFLNRDLEWDRGERISRIVDPNPARSQYFSYDVLDHLSKGVRGTSVEEYTYDADGNRKTGRTDTAVTTYSYPDSSNRLASLSGARNASYAYDDAGNIINDGSYSYTYLDGGRLGTVRKLSNSADTNYYYNGFGERIAKSGASGIRIYMYDSAGHLLGEYKTDGSYQEHVWLGDIPIANLRSGYAVPAYVLADHLNTPRVLVNGSTYPGTVLWAWDGDAFGASTPQVAGVEYNLRFPGQYFDAESWKHYNYYRDYDPGTGRYIQSDPIGLGGGVNTYGYVGGDPARGVDPTGLELVLPAPIPLPIPFPLARPYTPLPGYNPNTGQYIPPSGFPEISLPPVPNIVPSALCLIVPGMCTWVHMACDNDDERKVPKPGVGGKEGAKDVPSWAKGERPKVGESGKDFSDRLLNDKYGNGNYDKGPGSEHNQIKKWGDRSFVDP